MSSDPIPTPEFLYFDLGRVVIHFDHELAVQQLSEASGVSPTAVRDALLQSDWPHDYERGTMSTVEFCQRLRTETGCDLPDDQICWCISNIFHLNREMVPLLGALHQSGTRIGLLSNTCDAHWQFLLAMPYRVLELFPVQVLSFQTGAKKPESPIYAEATARAGVAPERIFFTDDLPENVQAARQAGWDAIQFTGVGDLANALRQRGLRFNY